MSAIYALEYLLSLILLLEELLVLGTNIEESILEDQVNH